MNTFFSVVIPLYNKENYISKTIESVLAQNFNEFEIIIVDDGSTDNSYNRIKKYKKNEKLTIIQKENGGVSSARNLGIYYVARASLRGMSRTTFVKVRPKVTVRVAYLPG